MRNNGVEVGGEIHGGDRQPTPHSVCNFIAACDNRHKNVHTKHTVRMCQVQSRDHNLALTDTRQEQSSTQSIAPIDASQRTMPRMRLQTVCLGFVADRATTTSPSSYPTNLGERRSSTTMSPEGLNVGIIDGPTHCAKGGA